jgi:DNA-binding CsgD family transcriptional regulator
MQENGGLVLIVSTLSVLFIVIALIVLFAVFQKKKNSLVEERKESQQRFETEIIENGFYHTKNVTNILMSSLTGNEVKEIDINEKERQFLKLSCTELTYKEIADKMCLSPKTIDNYRNSLFSKLNVKNRVGMVTYAIKNKIYTL